MVIRRVSPLSCAKVAGVLYAGMGLIIGLCVSLFFMVLGSQIDTSDVPGPLFGALFGAGAIVAMPIFYGAIGFVGAAIGALLYNAAAGMIGGIEIQIDNVAP